MGKNQSASNLTNIIKQDASGSIAFMSGSTMLMALSNTGQMSGSVPVLAAATASFVQNAQSASYVLTAQTASFVANAQTASFVANAQTASFVALAQSASNAVSAATASFANAFTVASTLTAQTLVVQTITSSIVYSSGSNVFGNSLNNTQTFTGSVLVTGSITAAKLTLSNLPSSQAIFMNDNAAYIAGYNATGTLRTGYLQFNSGSQVVLAADSTNYLSFNTNGSERLVITSTGAATFSSKVSVNNPISSYASGITVGGTGCGFMMYSSATGNQSSIQIFNGSLYGYGVVGIVSGTGASTGDVYALGWNSSANAAFTPILNWGSTGNVGIGTSPSSFKLDVNGGIRTTGLALIDNYSGQYTTDSAWTSLQTVIPANTLNAYETYLVEIRWEYNGATYAPYYADAAFLFKPVPTNSTGTGNTIALQTSCHVSGDFIISVAQQNASNASCGGLALKLNWTPSSPSYIVVKAKRIAIP